MTNEITNWPTNSLPSTAETTIKIPNQIATIKLCGGVLTFHIDDTVGWQISGKGYKRRKICRTQKEI